MTGGLAERCRALYALTFALLCHVGIFIAQPVEAASGLPTLIAEVRPAVVGVGLHSPLGAPRFQLGATGFAVGDGRTIVTNAHVVSSITERKNEARLVVFVGRGPSPSVRNATVARNDPEHDLALLRIDGDVVPTLPLAPDSLVAEGTDVLITGFPIGAVLGLYPVSHRGIVSCVVPLAIPQATSEGLTAAQIKRLQKPFEIYQLDAVAYPGNSGSPLISQASGLVIGIVNSVLAKEGRESALKEPSAITYAIPVQHLHKLLPPP